MGNKLRHDAQSWRYIWIPLISMNVKMHLYCSCFWLCFLCVTMTESLKNEYCTRLSIGKDLTQCETLISKDGRKVK